MLFVVSFVLVLIERLLSWRISLSQWVADLHAYRWRLVRPLGSIQEGRQVHVRVFESSCLQSFICTWFFRILVILGQLLRLRVSWGFFVKVVINQEIVHIVLSTLRLFVSFSDLHIVKLIVFCEHTEAQLSHNVIILSGLPCVSYNLINFFFLSDRSFARTFQIWYTFKVWYAFTQEAFNEIFKWLFLLLSRAFFSGFRVWNHDSWRGLLIKLLLINIIYRPEGAPSHTIFNFRLNGLPNWISERSSNWSSHRLDIWRPIMPREPWDAAPLCYEWIKFRNIVLRDSFLP